MENNKEKIQVKEGSYSGHGYNTLERFISYYYQTNLVIKYKAQNVLEVGTGNDITSTFLKKSGLNVTTCDFDLLNNPDIIADIRDLPCDDDSYDAVLAFQILEHIPFEDFGKALGELCRISRKHVFISIPYRSAVFEWVIRFPGIRSLFKKNFLDFSFRWPLKFEGFQTSGQHYWEIDSRKFKLKKVREEILKQCWIIEEFSPILNKFHYFFVLKPK